MDKFIKGMDVSTLPEETALGAKYYDEGKEGNTLEDIKKYSTNSTTHPSTGHKADDGWKSDGS